MRALIVAATLCLGGLGWAQGTASNYAEGLRLQNARTQAISAELLEMIRQDEKDPEVIASVGRRFLTEYDGAIGIMNAYRSATTRFGTQSEIDDIMELHLALQAGQSAIHVLVEGSPPPPLPPRDISLAREAFQENIVPLIKEFVDMQLEAQGAADFLTDPGLKEAGFFLASRIGSEIKAKAENEIQKVVGARIRLGMSLKEHILMMARTWVSKSVGSFILRFAANHFIVERLGVKLLEWVGPKVREFLRPKGNLKSRVERAVAGLKVRRSDLARMDSDEDMMDVRRLVEAAENHLKANDYLRKDLTRAKEDDLYQKLAAEESKLVEAIVVTKKAFLMNSKFAEVFASVTKDWKTGRERTANVLEKLEKQPAKASAGEYFAEATAPFKPKFPGTFGFQISKQGEGYHVRVTDQQGRTILDNAFKIGKKFADGSIRYEARGVAWPDGTTVPFVMMGVSQWEPNGLPTSGTLTWGTEGLTQMRLQASFERRSGTLLYAGSYRESSDRARFKLPEPFKVELSPSGAGFKLRVIDGSNKVIANAELRLAKETKSSSGQVSSRIYEASGGAWVDGAPLSKVMMSVDHFEDDGKTPHRGILTWFSAAGSKIVMQIAFRKPG
jgi:hypothetical protein